MSTARPVLVVGSYPPAATPGSGPTLDVVRAIRRDGGEPIVSSPRSSAAPYEVPVAGVVAGRRLLQLGRATGARTVVIVAERDFPVPVAGANPVLRSALQRATIAGLVRAVAAFDDVTVVRVGDTGVPGAVWAPLDRAVARVEHRDPGPALPGVTPLGPYEDRTRATARRVARVAARRALGPRYGPARARAARLVARARRAAGR